MGARIGLLVFFCSVACMAADFPAGGTDVLAVPAEFSGFGGEGGKVEKVADGTRVTVAKATPDQPWSASISSHFAKSVTKGDRLLLTYMARRTDGAAGSAAGKAQISGPPYDALGTTEAAEIGGKWERVNQPFVAERDGPAGGAELAIFLGGRTQTVEIAKVRLLDYGSDFDLAKLPRLAKTYVGREPDAPWRKAALARIAKIRQADMAVRIVDAVGNPRGGVEVTVELYRHEFGFGSCVTRDLLTAEGPDAEKYREIVGGTFSRVVFENDLKPDTFPHDAAGRATLEKALGWLAGEGISIRGHYLMQEAVDGWSRDQLADPQALEKATLDSVRERISAIGGRVVEWDVINHPIAWQGAELLRDKGPPLAGLDRAVFREARRLTDLPLCVNEDQLFRPGPQQDDTFRYLEKLRQDGFRVGGLGNQAHFDSGFLPSPEEMLRVTDRFAAVVPKQMITEFDVVTHGDEQLAADYLRDCLIMTFSHPAYDCFMLWGFWEGAHWKPEAALWEKDWTPRPSGRVWQEWVGGKWHTRVTVKADAAGVVKWRGFKGSYRIGGGPAVVPGGSENPVNVAVP